MLRAPPAPSNPASSFLLPTSPAHGHHNYLGGRPVTPEQAQLVRLSFVKVMDIKMAAGKLFYDRLFTIAPEVRPMFKGDIGAQGDQPTETLGGGGSALKNT